MQRSCRITGLRTLAATSHRRDLISAESVHDAIPSVGAAPAGSQVKVGGGSTGERGALLCDSAR